MERYFDEPWQMEPRAEAPPGLFAAYGRGIWAVRHETTTLAVMALATFGLGAASWHLMHHGGALGMAGALFAVFVAGPVAFNFDYLCLRAVRRQPIGARDTRRFKRDYAELVMANGVASLLVVGGLFLLVVPGIVLFCRLRFVSYLVLDEGLDAGEALRASMELTRGMTWRILGISAVGCGLFVLGLPLLGVGAAMGDLLARLAMAAFYDETVVGSQEVARSAY